MRKIKLKGLKGQIRRFLGTANKGLRSYGGRPKRRVRVV